ncbi:Transposable element P transposase [Frankliniella fusca]|uniref:Transposable element P transposase n=1 Tax=Frankliniella fusca TaxID=407009 RepID=A0AAE1L606_9NEOP|nr:Transposable element P transposase [Frankliniella fusca]
MGIDDISRSEWEVLIRRDGKPFTRSERVCSIHFNESNIIKFDEFVINGEVKRLPREHFKLKPGAKPEIFPDYPPYYKPKPKKRKSPKKRSSSTTPAIQVRAEGNDREEAILEREIENPLENVLVLVDEETGIQPVNIPPIVAGEIEIKPNIPAIPPAPEATWFDEIDTLILPNGNWTKCDVIRKEKKKVFVHISEENGIQIDKTVVFPALMNQNCEPKIVLRGTCCYEGDLVKKTVYNLKEAQDLLEAVHKIKLCGGTGILENPYSKNCDGAAKSLKMIRCDPCHKERKKLRRMEKKEEMIKEKLEQKRKQKNNSIRNLKTSKYKLQEKIKRYRKKIADAMEACRKTKKEVLDKAIKSLPEAQQEAVRSIFDASHRKGPRGRRYTIEWVYECMLMRIKSPVLYAHIRKHKILVIPSETTIKRYLKNYTGTYGFQASLFEMLSQKGKEMSPQKKRGVILIDEMKLTAGTYFDLEALKVGGFVDFGAGDLSAFGDEKVEAYEAAVGQLPGGDPQETAERRQQRNSMKKGTRGEHLGDHALVVMFQPFQGAWVQNLACFLTKGAASEDELTKIVLEAIILLENSGFLVDGVVTDGATWNRSMWTRFGVSESNPSSVHPCDSNPDRRLFFFSDYPHLLKCMRNCLASKKIIHTQEGDVKLDHWDAVVEADELRLYGNREAPRLTKEHIHPDAWSKMRCNLAWQFWSTSTAAAMECYRYQMEDGTGTSKLADSEASSKLCRLVDRLSDCMNSRTPVAALRPNSEMIKTIDEFLNWMKETQDYLTNKMHEAKLKAEKARVAFLAKRNKRFRCAQSNILKERDWVFSESTDVGLKVTLENTKSLLQYLCSDKPNLGYKYLMTSRLNQDALERFFGLMRQSCGGNTHPEARMFVQLFRLLSVYSLVKPLKGSNITGGDMLKTLMSLDDLRNMTNNERKKEFDKRLDEIIDGGDHYEPGHIEDVVARLEDHDYFKESIDEFALVYVSGFAARRSARFTEGCSDCEEALTLKEKDSATDEHLLIKLKTRGYLLFPSNELVNTLRYIEHQILKACYENDLEENFLFLVLDNLEKSSAKVAMPLVGCPLHREQLTKYIMKFYLVLRMHFACRRWNERTKELKKKQRRHRKEAHLT